MNTIIEQLRSITNLETQVSIDLENLILTIELSEITQYIIKQIHSYMNRVKPCNVVYRLASRIKTNTTEYYATAYTNSSRYTIKYTY